MKDFAMWGATILDPISGMMTASGKILERVLKFVPK
jgi:hypothetical protein